MANYIINFTLNGERHFTRGEMNYPTKEDFENENYSKEKAKEKAVMIIQGYMDVKQIPYDIHPMDVVFDIKFD